MSAARQLNKRLKQRARSQSINAYAESAIFTCSTALSTAGWGASVECNAPQARAVALLKSPVHVLTTSGTCESSEKAFSPNTSAALALPSTNKAKTEAIVVQAEDHILLRARSGRRGRMDSAFSTYRAAGVQTIKLQRKLGRTTNPRLRRDAATEGRRFEVRPQELVLGGCF